jgi:hypothetical protein
MKGGDIVHQKFLKQEVKDGTAVFTSVTHWMDESAKPFMEEERTFTGFGRETWWAADD